MRADGILKKHLYPGFYLKYNGGVMNLTASSLQKFIYAAVALLGLGFVGVTASAIYGHQAAENRFTVDLIFYAGLIFGVLGFLGLSLILYYRFEQRNRY